MKTLKEKLEQFIHELEVWETTVDAEMASLRDSNPTKIGSHEWYVLLARACTITVISRDLRKIL